MQTPW